VRDILREYIRLLVSMFALFSRVGSSREKFIQGVRLNAGFEVTHEQERNLRR
jgi:hypothetical protein